MLIKNSTVTENDFDCDCHLAWMHKLRHEAKSIKVRTSLENFVCKFNTDTVISSHLTYYERMNIESNVEEEKIRNDLNNDEFNEDSDDVYVEEPKRVKADNERTLLQIPVELLPCPAQVKTVTDRTYTYPSQNEAKDYRNLILSSSITCFYNKVLIVVLLLLLMFE